MISNYSIKKNVKYNKKYNDLKIISQIFSKILEINYKQSSLTEISEAYEEFGVSF